MLDRPRYRCQRFSGRPEGFGEDASFFFDRAGFGAARWRPRRGTEAPRSAVVHVTGRRIGWALILVGLIFCLVVGVGLAPLFFLHRTRAALSPTAKEQAVQVHAVPARSDGLRVPLSALRFEKDEPFVAIVDENDIAHFRKVRLGSRTQRDAEILSGLDGTEAVVAPLPESLQEGMKVVLEEREGW